MILSAPNQSHRICGFKTDSVSSHQVYGTNESFVERGEAVFFNFDVNNVDTEILGQELKRLEALRSDLLSLSLGNGPNLTTHADAPILDPWTYTPCVVHRLLGYTNNQPDFAHVTTELVCIDRTAGWARTRSRWYRLGECMEEPV